MVMHIVMQVNHIALPDTAWPHWTPPASLNLKSRISYFPKLFLDIFLAGRELLLSVDTDFIALEMYYACNSTN